MTAAKFVEGQDRVYNITDEEHREAEFRQKLGHTKRSFGNAHNKSDFRFDYADDPGYETEYVNETIMKDPVTDIPRDALLRWGAGHGRRKFDIDDHFYKDGKSHIY